MSTAQSVVTKAEVDSINTLLDLISSSLHAHQDGNVTPSHPDGLGVSFSAQSSVYTDSDSNVEGTSVVKIRIGSTSYYAPAKSGPSDISAPALSKDAPGTAGPTALITPFAAAVAAELQDKISLLNAHITKAYNSASAAPHGVLTMSAGVTKDTGDFKVGRNLIAISVGGVNYKIVCDTSPTGPPKLPKVDGFYYKHWSGTSEANESEAIDADTKAQVIAQGSGTSDNYHTRVYPRFIAGQGDPTNPCRYRWRCYARDGWYLIDGDIPLPPSMNGIGGSKVVYTNRDKGDAGGNEVAYWTTDALAIANYGYYTAAISGPNGEGGTIVFEDAIGAGGSETAYHEIKFEVANLATLHDGVDPGSATDDDFDWIDYRPSGAKLLFIQKIVDDS